MKNATRPLESFHRESLLSIPLVRQMLADPHVQMVPRRIDHDWFVDGVIPYRTSGFNPSRHSVYFAANSPLCRWLEDPTGSARDLNEADRLVDEVLISVHDYLHCWAYGAIHEIFPKLGMGHSDIRPHNVEDLVFAHLLSEAVATVGLDYWFLSAVDLNEVCPIGTTRTMFAVGYREADRAEFRRFNPEFNAQHEGFFGDVSRFYCSGEIQGFGVRDLAKSPKLLAWLNHELKYGENQRRITRLWFAHLSQGTVKYSDRDLVAPVSVRAGWKARLIESLGALLWRKVKLGELLPFRGPGSGVEVWQTRPNLAPDFRFVNLNALSPDWLVSHPRARLTPGSFQYLCYQYLSQFDRNTVSKPALRRLRAITDGRDLKELILLLKGAKRVSSDESAPQDLLMMN